MIKMYETEYSDHIIKVFKKLRKKNPKQMRIIAKKIDEIILNPHRYKNLKNPLQHCKRVHIDDSFVLVYSVDEKNKIVKIKDYDHHDNIYKKSIP